MLGPLLLIAVATSTAEADRAPLRVEDEWVDDEVELDGAEVLRDIQEEGLRARQRLWDADRRIRLTLGASVWFPVVDRHEQFNDFDLRLEGALGVRIRMTPAWELHPRLSLAAALFALRLSGLDLNTSFRWGTGKRFYLGVGPLMRMVLPDRLEVFVADGGSIPTASGPAFSGNLVEERRPLEYGGGGVLEVGGLLGGNRTTDLAARASFGFTTSNWSDVQIFVSVGFAVSFSIGLTK